MPEITTKNLNRAVLMPNGHKITIFLEEVALPYSLIPINIGAGDQFKPEFLKISPNNRIPAIVDRSPADSGEPISIFESGAILEYLADKTGKLIPADIRGRAEVLQWLYWQMGGLGPMAGQNHHFSIYAPEKIPYAINWFEAIKARPATIRAYEKAEAFKNQQISPEQVRDLLFNQSASTVKR
jgi:GSH-dependent disulfide-bond oxidoreductase